MSLIQRFSAIRRGAIVFTGNTLGLAPAVAGSNPSLGSIAVFTSLDTSNRVTGFPAGTTLDYTRNGSAAVLNLPADATVVYAELVWGGLYKSSSSDISALTDNAVVFSTPLQTTSVTGVAATRNNLLLPTGGAGSYNLGFYTRSAEVTALVKAAKSGRYSLSAVPALIASPSSLSSDTNHAGWTLAVIYESPSSPLRDLTLWCGAAAVSIDRGSSDFSISGFITPEAAPVSGKLFVSAQEGDAVIGGDRMLFGKNAASLHELSSPNNPVANFFCSQINDSDGQTDTSGTFGTRNAFASAGQNTSACRQGWDITASNVSTYLETSQNTALVRLTTSGDLYVANALALQIDSKGANVTVAKSAAASFVPVGGQTEYTLVLENTGDITANNISVTDPLPVGLSLVGGSVTLNGAPYAGGFPVNIASLASGETATVRFDVIADSLPVVNPTLNSASARYYFSPFAGMTVAAKADSNEVPLFIVSDNMRVVKSVDKTVAEKGDELTYSFTVSNLGNTVQTNAVFTDVPPQGTVFVPDSVTLNGAVLTGANPADGIPIGTLGEGQTVTLSFKVTIR